MEANLRARVYVRGLLIGELAVEHDWGHEPLKAAEQVIVAFFKDHPEPGERPLMLQGKLETL